VDAAAAVNLFAERYGGGSIKLFGGEPLLVPNVVRSAMEAARDNPAIRWVYLSTNGLGLTREWLDYFKDYPKGILTISMDGQPEDHRGQRRLAKDNVADSYDHILSIKSELLKTPRVVVTQTIAPSTAKRAAVNLNHLLELGFWRFNFLPGYYIPWKSDQVSALHDSFGQMMDIISARWNRMERTYVRNLFTYAPTPFFNTGLVVDADRTIHPSNIGLSGTLDHLREQTIVGDLDSPPTRDELQQASSRVNAILETALTDKVYESTQAVDRELSQFCRSLYPHWARYKRRRDAA